MTWTYDEAIATDRDKIRFLIADTDASDPLLSDEVIAGVLALQGELYKAAAACAQSLALKFAREPDFGSGELNIAWRDRAERYRQMARDLAGMAAGSIGTPFVGGISVSEIRSVNDDTDRVPNKFRVSQDDFPGAPAPTDPAP